MLAKRIIPCLDVKDGRTVKGTNFVGLRDAGDPVELLATVLDMSVQQRARMLPPWQLPLLLAKLLLLPRLALVTALWLWFLTPVAQLEQQIAAQLFLMRQLLSHRPPTQLNGNVMLLR